ncbi:MAG: alpha-ribazole phosphatase [Bacteroidota bacterium]
MEVYVIRHTKVAVKKGICYGQSEVPLADTFLEEVNIFQQVLPPEFDKIYSSPLQRCVQLANTLNLKEVITDTRLKEMHFGTWEGKQWNTIDQKLLNRWMEDFVHINPPEGENLLMLYKRCESFLDDLAKQDYNKILLVTHAGFIRCVWAYFLDIPLKNSFKIPVGFQEISIFNLAEKKENCFIIQVK